MPSYPRPHAMVQALAERAEDFILQSYKIRDVPLRLRPVSVEAEAAALRLPRLYPGAASSSCTDS